MYLSLIFDIKEDYDAGYVVNDILFSLPLFKGCSNQVLSCPLSVALQKVRVHDFGNLLVLQELPHAVTRQNYYFVLAIHTKLSNFRHCIYTNASCHLIAERSTHCQTRYIFILEPDALGPNFVSVAVAVGVNAASSCFNHLQLFWVIWLVVSRQRPCNAPCWNTNSLSQIKPSKEKMQITYAFDHSDPVLW